MKMNTKYLFRQSILLFNQIAIIAFLFIMHTLDYRISIDNLFHLTILTLLFLDAAYISFTNIKNNAVLIDFSVLLLLHAWQFLLSLYESSLIAMKISTLLIAPMLYQTMAFVISFVFQNSTFKYKKPILLIMQLTCLMSICTGLISDRLFSLAYLLQFLITLLVFGFLLIFQHERIYFVFKSQLNQLLFSFFFIAIPFGCYIFVFHSNPDLMSNLGSYLIISLSFTSIHSIVFKKQTEQKKYYASRKPFYILLLLLCILFAVLLMHVFRLNFIVVFTIIHFSSFLIQTYHLFSYCQYRMQIAQKKPMDQNHFYACSLSQLRQEESLKEQFSNYLHDEILQDLLSIKNLIKKANQPQIQQMILDALDSLNFSIRNRMEEYHPVLVKSLTLKDNFKNLIDTTKSLFPGTACNIYLDCDNDSFLVMPYDTIIYRILKELLVNCLKHANASEIHILFTQQNGLITLSVNDNGKGMDTQPRQSADANHHHGISSISDQLYLLNGNMDIISEKGKGTKVIIMLPMKGENSYDNFIN